MMTFLVCDFHSQYIGMWACHIFVIAEQAPGRCEDLAILLLYKQEVLDLGLLQCSYIYAITCVSQIRPFE